MPIEIRELIIRATVADGAADKPRSDPNAAAEAHEDVVAECVDQVLRVLRDARER